jgi:glycosyltransferase involved in cell wall biosynthesis
MRVLAWPIDTGLNPYTSLLYANLGPDVQVDAWPGNLLRKYSIWHIHWPDALLNIRNPAHAAFKASGMLAATDFMRLRGTKLIWTMHNFHSHEALHPTMERWLWRQFIPKVDGAISLSQAGLSLALKKFPRLQEIPVTVIPHGHYRGDYPPSVAGARKTLGIPTDARVAMFFGAVRAYKSVADLVRVFRNVKSPNAILYIVGRPNSESLAREIEAEAAKDERVRLKFVFVEPHEASTYLAAADLVVLPYREVLNSGSALLALSCSRPILVPDLGAMGELKLHFGEDWVRTFEGPISGNTLENGLAWSAEARPGVCPMPAEYDWASIGDATVKFYERVADGAETRVQAGAF